MIGKTIKYNNPIPVIDKSSSIYFELQSSIKNIENLLIEAHPKQILIEIAKLRLHYYSGKLSAKEEESLLDDYVNDLAKYPIDLIRIACVKYRQNANNLFFPKIGQLIELISDPWYDRKWQLTKMQKLLELSIKGSK
jgi:hypothetical protein